MARKLSPSARPKKKATRPVDRPASVNLPLRAHPRLVHGFLVRLTGRSAIATPGTGRASITTTASAKAPAERSSDPKHEGPADDATFH
jgi:hypothetical protein